MRRLAALLCCLALVAVATPASAEVTPMAATGATLITIGGLGAVAGIAVLVRGEQGSDPESTRTIGGTIGAIGIAHAVPGVVLAAMATETKNKRVSVSVGPASASLLVRW